VLFISSSVIICINCTGYNDWLIMYCEGISGKSVEEVWKYKVAAEG
jgi:hypothetical protein